MGRKPHAASRFHGAGSRHALVRSSKPARRQVNIEIMRAFVRLRQVLRGNAELSRRFDELEETYDGQIRIIFDAIRELDERRNTTH